ncbi:DMT family transporter [Ruegeria jejuensis]|uniref:DMT family transporter n=1 Tax=Ruegeria jejuensis TaxID=3233338 RepID=UPI00355C1E90
MERAPSHSPALAALLIVLASVFLAGTTLLAKALGTEALGPALHPMQISHGRFLFAFLLIVTVVLAARPKLGKVHWRLHLGRTSCGWVGITLTFAAVAYIPVTDATAISFLNPVFAMLLAIPLLHEKVGPIRWLAAGIALMGALILLRPTPASFDPAALLALAAAAMIGLELILIKQLSGRERPIQVLLVNNSIGLTIATLAVLPVWQMPNGAQWVALASLGGLMACAQFCFVNGMARADASFVAPFSYATLVFVALMDFAVFGVIPDTISLTGAAVIIAGALLLALREGRLARA